MWIVQELRVGGHLCTVHMGPFFPGEIVLVATQPRLALVWSRVYLAPQTDSTKIKAVSPFSTSLHAWTS